MKCCGMWRELSTLADVRYNENVGAKWRSEAREERMDTWHFHSVTIWTCYSCVINVFDKAGATAHHSIHSTANVVEGIL